VRRNGKYRSRGFGNESSTGLIGAQPIAQFDPISLREWNSPCSRPRKQCDFSEQPAIPNGEHAESPFAVGGKVRREPSQPLGENRHWRWRRNASRDPRAKMIPVCLQHGQEIACVFGSPWT
jgi:hypothetical protein